MFPYFSVTETKRQDNVGGVNSIPEKELLGKLFIKCKGKIKSNKIGMLLAFSFDNLSHLITSKRFFCICCQN